MKTGSISILKRKSKIPAETMAFETEFSDHHARADSFKSVLTQPFKMWNAIESAVEEGVPEWTHSQRSKTIEHLIRFLELKVIMEEYSRDAVLLAPTTLVASAWTALAQKMRIYQKVTMSIQDFHGSIRRKIPKPPKEQYHDRESAKGYQQRLERTQCLFSCYYEETMPEEVEDLAIGDTDGDDSCSDWSVLSDMTGTTTPGLPSRLRDSLAAWFQYLSDPCFTDPAKELSKQCQLPPNYVCGKVRDVNDSVTAELSESYSNGSADQSKPSDEGSRKSASSKIGSLPSDERQQKKTERPRPTANYEVSSRVADQSPGTAADVPSKKKPVTKKKSPEQQKWDAIKTKLRIAAMIIGEFE